MLNLEGYEAYGAENGIKGVDIAKKVLPDLIVCDIMMPEMDGYQVLETLREDPETAMIPFIFLTAKAERVSMRQGMVLGADDYLTKPFMVTELLESIHAQLKKRTELNEVANQRLEELRQSIVTALPHELRTPLNTIIGFSDMMMIEAQNLKPDQVASWADHINKAAHRLYRLIENYLFYARMQVAVENRTPMRVDDPLYDLYGIVSTEGNRIARQAEREGDLVVDIATHPDLEIAHKDAIKLVYELIENAFKFSEPGQEVRVTGQSVADGYEIRVQDKGRGMTAEQMKHVGAYMQFDRFIHEQQGMGLGLAIVKALADVYKGEFKLESAEEKGTTAIFRFNIS
jgi:signal transduction histidine kinase